MLHFLFAPCGARFSQLRNQKYPVDLYLFAVCRYVSTLLIVSLLLGGLQSAQAQLPTGIGWTALPATTSLEGSGACPPNYFGGDPYPFANNCQNVIRAWSGAIADTTLNRLIIWGGGHMNYFGNEIYSLNLTANPITLTRLKDPTVPTNYMNGQGSTQQSCVESIPPGTTSFAPNSREDYEGFAFIPVNRFTSPNADVMYILNGSTACQLGGASIATWTISLNNLSNSSSWIYENPTLTGPQPGIYPGLGGSPYGNIAAYDPNTGLVFVSDNSAIFTYNYQSNTYTRITAIFGFETDIYLSGAIDPTRKLFVTVGNCSGGNPFCAAGAGVFVADISNPTTTTQQNWTTATLADPICSEFLSGGVNPISSANPGITFDSVANDFVAWPNQGNSVYILTPDPENKRFTCQKQTFPNGPPNSAHRNVPNSTNGTFGRFQYFPALDVFVLINDGNIPPYILRLRSSTAPDFTLSALPSSAPVTPGGMATYTVSETALNGFTDTVNLSVSGLPAGATASLNPTSITGGSGTSTLTVQTSSSTPAGSPSLTISGTSGALTHSATVVLSVSDFTLSVGPGIVSVTPGNTATYTVSAASLNGFSGNVSLGVSGLPGNATASFNPTSIAPGGPPSTLTVTTTSSTPLGNPTLTITGTSGTLTHSVTVILSVSNFTLSVSPGSASVSPGGKTTYTVSETAPNGFTGTVNLSVSGLPAGATASLNPTSITGSGTSMLTVQTSSSTPPGSATLTITGQNGSFSQTTTTTLVVRPKKKR
jgi:hypothetical protein